VAAAPILCHRAANTEGPKSIHARAILRNLQLPLGGQEFDAMKSKGKANPQMVNQLLKEKQS
jgi:hypothetical protein